MVDRAPSGYGSGEADQLPVHDHEVYNQIASEGDFAELSKRYRSFAFPATIAFMVWYVTYVICNNWARDFMDTIVFGNINVALVFGLLQFVSTFLIAWLYERYMVKNVDPLAAQIRADFDREAVR